MIVRDEADIVELCIRHNLALLDGIAVIDHGSVDGSREILAALGAEGIGVSVSDDPLPAFEQMDRINALARHVFATTDVDWVFPIDADEFLYAPSRDALEEALAAVPPGRAAGFASPTVVPSFDPNRTLVERLDDARWQTGPQCPWSKVAVPRAALARPDVAIGHGQHSLVALAPAASVAQPVALPDNYAYLHVPIRSQPQFVGKFGSGWLSIVAKDRRRPTFSGHWGAAFDRLTGGEPLDHAWLARFAANYGHLPADWRIDADTLGAAPRFLRASELRYQRYARGDPLPRILAQAERLLLSRH